MDYISTLLYKRLLGEELTDAEASDLKTWMSESPYNRQAAERLSDLSFLEKEFRLQSVVQSATACAEMQNRIKSLSSRKHRTVMKLSAIAAMLTVVVAVGIGIIVGHQDLSEPVTTAESEFAHEVTIEDFKHGQMIAHLTDESGNTRTLHGATVSAPVADVKTPKTQAKGIENLKLEVPRGGEFKVVLEDSTEVWLNSESTLCYPEVFGDTERRVEVTGEAYFSVKKDENRPFYVVSGAQQIRVYGTTFNVRGYGEDKSIFTTLESGQIALSKLDGSGGELRLSPGHQAVFDRDDMKVSLKVVNPAIVTSWRHGKFVFDEQPLSAIMCDLARWYNFDYEFEDKEVAAVVFKGTIPRYGDLKDAITILEYSGGMEFRYEDGKLKIRKV